MIFINTPKGMIFKKTVGGGIILILSVHRMTLYICENIFFGFSVIKGSI